MIGDNNQREPPRFLDSEPFHHSKRLSKQFQCDLAVPGDIGIGSLVCYTPLVEALALKLGRPIRLLTTPLSYSWFGRVEGETDYPLWENNPYISEIVDANRIDPEISNLISAEMDNFSQTKHEIENICSAYGLRPRHLRGCLFLTTDEMKTALETLSSIRRPVVCLCPYGRSSSLPESPWYLTRWLSLIERLNHQAGFVQIGNNHFNQKPLPIFTPPTTIRQAMSIIWASDLYIGFDTGVSHIATALGKPAAVLWDAVRKAPLEEEKEPGFSAATMLRWAYPQNRNLMILGEKKSEVLDECIEFALDSIRRLTGSASTE